LSLRQENWVQQEGWDYNLEQYDADLVQLADKVLLEGQYGYE